MSKSDGTASLMTPAKLAQQSGKAAAPVSPSAWLDRMASDAGHQHLQRLEELVEVLQTHARARQQAPFRDELAALSRTLPLLDFELLNSRGWWARTTGKGRGDGEAFAGQFDDINAAAKALAGRVQAAQKSQSAESAATERTLVEFEVEYRALDKIIDQGSRWLQDMRTQLKAQHAAAADAQAQQQVRDDAARCEILVARLKLLQGVAKATQQTHQQAQAAAAARASLLQRLEQKLGAEARAWNTRLAALASSAADGQTAALNLDGAKDAHRALGLRVEKTTVECSTLQKQEDALAASLSALHGQLRAPA